MDSLAEFLERQLNKNVRIFEYKNQNIGNNQHLISFNNNSYVIEIINNKLPDNINGFCYLFFQNNLDFNSLSKILYNLFENIEIFKHENFLVVLSKKNLCIDKSTLDIVETESYRSTNIINLGKIDSCDDFNLKYKIVDELFKNTFLRDENINKIATISDLKIYKFIDICSSYIEFEKLININTLKSIDKNLIKTGVNFIENDLNISKTSTSLFLHRNTLIYRLDKIKETLNLDLRNFKDAFIFYISSKYFLYFNK